MSHGNTDALFKRLNLFLSKHSTRHEVLPQRRKKRTLLKWIEIEWSEGVLKPLCIWLIWLTVGTAFYGTVDFDGNYAKGFYYAVNVGYSIGWGVLHDQTDSSKLFSVFYLVIGATAISRWLV
jgi:hypothetical protein